jgi:hypothetical protein
MTVTPIKYDLTNYSYITKLKAIIEQYWCEYERFAAKSCITPY